MTKLPITILPALLIATMPVHAQERETLHITQGQVMALPELPADVSSVIVGDADIADLKPVAHNGYLVFGRKAGVTNVLAFDDKGNEVFDAIVTVNIAPIAVPQRGRGDVRIYNLPKFGSQEYYCTPRGCEKTQETKYERPAQIFKYEGLSGGAQQSRPVEEEK